MKKLHNDYPHYGWDTNVGYPTKKHFAGLREHGITKHHRRSFRLRTEKEWRAAET
jgi:ribonuclease HII